MLLDALLVDGFERYLGDVTAIGLGHLFAKPQLLSDVIYGTELSLLCYLNICFHDKNVYSLNL